MQSLYEWLQGQMSTLSRHSDTAKAFIDRNLKPKKIKKHPKTDVYSTLPACHECTAVN
ncbi:hypothetical protein EC970259_B0050 [Escherichia coli 99.0741]|nr:hypothetical protein EC970259_B0050 [Escherichia coli 99.0741]